jgi:hypothetical protein
MARMSEKRVDQLLTDEEMEGSGGVSEGGVW